MSHASTLHSLIEHLLPDTVSPATCASVHHPRLFGDVGLPTPGLRGAALQRLAQADLRNAVYAALRRQAIEGSVAALTNLGWAWLNGRYWRADPLLANHLLRMAALQGCAIACFNLGQQHYFGKGVEVSYTQAAAQYRRAFASGMPQAAAALADLYEEEVCEGDQAWSVDPVAAYAWFLRGAEQGDARCRYEVGYRLLHGLQVEADAQAALDWLELASADGVVQAAEELAAHFSRCNAARSQHWRAQALALGRHRSGADGPLIG